MKRTSQGAKSSAADVLIVGICCLAAGVGIGYYFGSSAPSSAAAPAVTESPQTEAPAMDDATFRKTEAELKTMLASSPKDVNHLVQLGNLYYDNKKFSQAIDAYGKALDLEPNNVPARTDRGSCYWSLGQADAAIGEFQKSLQLDPNHAQTLYNIGIVYLHGKNDVAAAQRVWAKLIETNPTYPEAGRIRQMLGSLGTPAGGQRGAADPPQSGSGDKGSAAGVEDLFRKLKK